jgi:hypothetical protein
MSSFEHAVPSLPRLPAVRVSLVALVAWQVLPFLAESWRTTVSRPPLPPQIRLALKQSASGPKGSTIHPEFREEALRSGANGDLDRYNVALLRDVE